MSDIDLSAVSTEDLLKALSARLADVDLKKLDGYDRWQAPEQIDVVHAVLKLLAKPRIPNDGGWPVVPVERVHEMAYIVGLLRQSAMEPDPDGSHVIRIHYENRRDGYLAAQPLLVPHKLLTLDDIKIAQRALGMLGNSVNRISDEITTALGYYVADLELTDDGHRELAMREEQAEG
ncbi:hypothetical protein [Rhizobium sp. BK176]|uniref:hypothetical protein n=1 Tax=Rhizobium sp. BK176 TaxID=2587071 RepID=UPI00216847D3|nr:hypothetical protein [Rhizobium sp. BK176]MCS4088530.1 hypothetical protein [Rhizobium sp. BK176]